MYHYKRKDLVHLVDTSGLVVAAPLEHNPGTKPTYLVHVTAALEALYHSLLLSA